MGRWGGRAGRPSGQLQFADQKSRGRRSGMPQEQGERVSRRNDPAVAREVAAVTHDRSPRPWPVQGAVHRRGL